MNSPTPQGASLAEFVASIQHLPLFTGMAAELIRSVERDDVTSAELSRLIVTDPALVTDLLRKVNSAFYGLSRQVESVSQAIAVLGLDQVRRIVTTAVLQRPLLAYLHDSEGSRAMWRHQLLCAAVARVIHSRRGGDSEAAYMAGLLHDVGRLALVMQFPQFADGLLERHGDAATATVLWEREQFGFDHALVGAALLELWGMPAGIVLATGQHENRAEPGDPLAASVWLANVLSHHLADHGDAPGDDEEALISVGLTEDTRRRVLAEVSALEHFG
jgi:HD-like signal output (HDOD) protein